ncbi:TetR/AcrR family transcriptional regulator [Peribacillus frigoritolerans]|uniref:TetR/AcrR family transcriptional regulator n=1 Tax=Peribacillus frigoritolerans TaxID=450367 RepID=UPI00345DA302
MRYNTGEETKANIIQAAFKLFGTKGYGSTSVDDILNEVGRTRGAFYTHFKSKEELLMEVMRIRMEIHMDDLEHMFKEQVKQGTFEIKSFIQQFLKVLFETTTTRPYWTGVYLELIKQSSQYKEIQDCINNAYDSWVNLFEKIFKKAKELNQIKPKVNEKILATSLVALYEGYEIHRYVNPNVNLCDQILMYEWLFSE